MRERGGVGEGIGGRWSDSPEPPKENEPHKKVSLEKQITASVAGDYPTIYRDWIIKFKSPLEIGSIMGYHERNQFTEFLNRIFPIKGEYGDNINVTHGLLHKLYNPAALIKISFKVGDTISYRKINDQFEMDVYLSFKMGLDTDTMTARIVLKGNIKSGEILNDDISITKASDDESIRVPGEGYLGVLTRKEYDGL